MVDYAVKRTKSHIHRFTRLWEQIRERRVEAAYVGELEWKDNIFSDIDYTVYA
jgi:1,4-alpha-glucan branching enzyme